jgi:hypothetical protein
MSEPVDRLAHLANLFEEVESKVHAVNSGHNSSLAQLNDHIASLEGAIRGEARKR